MNKYILIIVILNGCAPISQSVPKGLPCNDVSSYESVSMNERSYDVETKMGKQPDSEIVNGASMTQVYATCRQFEFNYLNDEVISKRIK